MLSVLWIELMMVWFFRWNVLRLNVGMFMEIFLCGCDVGYVVYC